MRRVSAGRSGAKEMLEGQTGQSHLIVASTSARPTLRICVLNLAMRSDDKKSADDAQPSRAKDPAEPCVATLVRL